MALLNENLVEEIKRRLPLTVHLGLRAGAQTYCPFANCPSHQKGAKKATVYDGGFKCYRCDRHGDIFTWFQETKGLNFGEALKRIAQEAGLSLSPPKERSRILQAVVRAANRNLMGSPDNISYLTKERGLPKGLLMRFQIGYVDPESRVLLESGVSEEELYQVGLLQDNPETGRIWCPMAGRFTFPVRNEYGSVVQIKGRANPALLWDPQAPKSLPLVKQPKRAPATWGPISHMDYLYLEETLHAARHAGYLVICEGEPDTLTAAALGLPAVGLFGCTGMFKHAHKLENIPKIYIALDNDDGTEKALDFELLKFQAKLPDTELLRVRIPHLAGPGEKVDLNDYVHRFGKKFSDFKALMAEAQPAYEIIIDRVAKNLEGDLERIGDLKYFVDSCRIAPREVLMKRIQSVSGMPEAVLNYLFHKPVQSEVL